MTLYIGRGWPTTLVDNMLLNDSAVFKPSSLNSCKLWLRADLGVTTSASKVTNWKDQSISGLSYAFTGTGATLTTVSGQQAIAFDGTLAYGELASSITIPQPFTTIAVAQLLGSAYVWYLIDSANASPIGLSFVNNGAALRIVAGYAYQTVALGTTASGNNTILGVSYTNSGGANDIVYQNGTLQGTQAVSGVGTNSIQLARICIDTTLTYPWNGTVSELMVFNKTLTANEFKQVHRYLGLRYGITVP